MSSATVGLIKPQAPVVGVSEPIEMEGPMGPARRRKRKKMEMDGMKPQVGKPMGRPTGKPIGKPMPMKDPMSEMMGGAKPVDKKMEV